MKVRQQIVPMHRGVQYSDKVHDVDAFSELTQTFIRSAFDSDEGDVIPKRVITEYEDRMVIFERLDD